MTAGNMTQTTETTPGPDELLLDRAEAVALKLAREAGELVRDRLDDVRAVTMKGSVDLVTDADQASEEIIAGGLREAFPDHRLIGEEGSRGSESSRYGWIIDPLDGTTNYAHRYPVFAVSIGLEFDGEVVLGAVFDPMRDELFHARVGRGAFINDTPIRVSETDELISSLLASGFSYIVEERTHSFALWQAINNAAQGVRRGGAAALDICYVAAGRLDGYFERPVNAWDIGAGAIILLEAGGKITGLEGGPFGLYDREATATNGKIHDELVGTIRKTLGDLVVG
jgi:myo-inositol-1(or 4)-monophosphatase